MSSICLQNILLLLIFTYVPISLFYFSPRPLIFRSTATAISSRAEFVSSLISLLSSLFHINKILISLPLSINLFLYLLLSTRSHSRLLIVVRCCFQLLPPSKCNCAILRLCTFIANFFFLKNYCCILDYQNISPLNFIFRLPALAIVKDNSKITPKICI